MRASRFRSLARRVLQLASRTLNSTAALPLAMFPLAVLMLGVGLFVASSGMASEMASGWGARSQRGTSTEAPIIAPAHGVRNEEDDPKVKVARGLAEQLVRVPSNKRRSEILEEMIAHADGHNPSLYVLRDALIELWNKTNKRLGSKQSLRSFTKILRDRGKLDELRVSTLALIRDEELYPYPCSHPDATPEAVAKFTKSQKKIDKAVDEMRKLWRGSPKVKVPTLMHEHLGVGIWTIRARKRTSEATGLNFKLPAPDLPAWVYGLPERGAIEGDVVTLGELGMSLSEQKAFAKSRAIRALNRRLLDETLATAKNQYGRDRILDEFRQVEHTNNYRQIFGLHALAWDVRLYQACRKHADYLRESGEFTHFQPDAEFRTIAARAEWAGYGEQVYENCHRGSNDPFDAHDLLCHSSAHHRTILLEKVHEIATARSGLVWVQNYGLDTGFQSAIQWGAWRD